MPTIEFNISGVLGVCEPSVRVVAMTLGTVRWQFTARPEIQYIHGHKDKILRRFCPYWHKWYSFIWSHQLFKVRM